MGGLIIIVKLIYYRLYIFCVSKVRNKKGANNFWKYFLVAVIFWVVVDFTTTEGIKNPSHYYSIFMPALLLFYIGYPLLFAFLIYKRKWADKKIFYPMLAFTFILEIIIFHNPLMYTFPVMLVMIPVAVCIYSFVTYVPKWIVERKMAEHKKLIILLALVWFIVSLLNFIGRA